jgi:hypothetical protein
MELDHPLLVLMVLPLAENEVGEVEMEQHTLKNVNNCLNTNIYSYLETSCGQSSYLYLDAVHFFNTSVY